MYVDVGASFLYIRYICTYVDRHSVSKARSKTAQVKDSADMSTSKAFVSFALSINLVCDTMTQSGLIVMSYVRTSSLTGWVIRSWSYS